MMKDTGTVSPGDRIVVGGSGGPDSTCLLHILAALTDRCQISLAAAYFDHGLRPNESPLEEEQVQRQAEELNIPFFSDRVITPLKADNSGRSLEEAARQHRYVFFDTVRGQFKGNKVAVGHTADDQVEELLLRLIRGSGRKGLAGMEYMRDGWLIRPLLESTKEEVLDYLRDKHIPFSIDSSNQEKVFLRNRVRLDLLPYLEEHYHPGIRNVLRQTTVVLQEEEHLLESMAQSCYKLVVVEDEGWRLSVPGLLQQHRALQRRVMEKILIRADIRVGFRQVGQLISLAEMGREGAMTHLAKGFRAERRADTIIFSFPKGRAARRGDLIVQQADRPFDIMLTGPGRFELDAERTIEVICSEKIPDRQEMIDGHCDYFDRDQLTFPLQVRNRQAGDSFYPLGSKGHKKVADFLIEQKVNRSDRDRVPVLICRNEIAALLGLRIAHPFRIGPESDGCLALRVFSKQEKN